MAQPEPPPGRCPACNGTGIVPSTACTCVGPPHICAPRACPDCGGSGHEKP